MNKSLKDKMKEIEKDFCPPMAAALVRANCADMVRVAEEVNG
ncbi:hypothetical protein [Maridesulfovibrio ferrireducens]|nr:hypothetical protein [Maridesulfovibrio ferrireducens]